MRTLTRQQVVRAYRIYAPLYDRAFGAVLEPGRRALTRAVRADSPERVLEVGVGTGLTLAHYPRTALVYGIDLCPEMLARAQRRADRMLDRTIELETMDAEDMQFPTGSFDCVTVPYVLSVTPDPARLVRELRRVCKPGGSIYILNHFSGSRFWWFLERAVRTIADRVGFRSDFSFEEHVLAHGWTVEQVTPVNLMGLSKLVKIRNG
jgi:phosphatidylethanolamine/phosphatidyl-N-methylethanolamine N-methyltransferase